MTTTRPTPTPAELLAAARALLAQAEAMMREPAEAAPTPSKPEPIGTWGGHTDWIAWSGGACPVPGDVPVQAVFRIENERTGYDDVTQSARLWRWDCEDSQYDIIAYRLATPAAPPVQEPEPKPAGVVLRGWRHDAAINIWYLDRPRGNPHAAVSVDGWSVRLANGKSTSGPETGLRGKAAAVERLLADGARWESSAAEAAAKDHDTRAIHRFTAGDVAVMVDGTRRTVEETTRTRILFSDRSWLTTEAAETAIAARIPAADRT